MKTLYFECHMGAAGDMLMASLLELHDDPEGFVDRLNTIGLGDHGVRITRSPSAKCGIVGSQVLVTINGLEEKNTDMQAGGHDNLPMGTQEPDKQQEPEDHHEHRESGIGHTHTYTHNHAHTHTHTHNHTHNHAHHHLQSAAKQLSNMHSIESIIRSLNISDNVKNDALKIYSLIAEAESKVHGVPVSEIHFHEVGNMDAVADIVGVCTLIEELAPDLILASPVCLGSGQVRCAHGILPVPAPATAEILQNVPVFGGNIRGELCTPTGAAILKYFVKEFGVMPVMSISAIGYGMGKKDFEQANCVRVFMGKIKGNKDEVAELSCNLDDMTPEAIAYAQQLLLDEGALDVYITSVGMKKGRNGMMFTCMCRRESTDKMVALIFKHTTTIGIRENISRRYVLERKRTRVATKYGDISVKTAYGYGVEKSKAEYEDLAKIARNKGISLADVREEIK